MMTTSFSQQQLLARLRSITPGVSRRLDGYLAGEFRGLRFGAGTEWAGLTEFNPQVHDQRHVNWRRSQPGGDLFVNQYEPERSLRGWILADLSGSMDFGFEHDHKLVAQIEAALVFGLLMSRRGNRLGALLMQGDGLYTLRPRSGVKQAVAVWSNITRAEIGEGETLGPAAALRRFRQVQKGRGMCVICSDWLAEDGWQEELRRTATHHDVYPVHVIHPLEVKLPEEEFDLQDPETGEWVTVDGRDERTQTEFDEAVKVQQGEISDGFKRARVKPFSVNTERNTIEQLLRQLKTRQDTRRW